MNLSLFCLLHFMARRPNINNVTVVLKSKLKCVEEVLQFMVREPIDWKAKYKQCDRLSICFEIQITVRDDQACRA